jgi:hypothetical protein
MHRSGTTWVGHMLCAGGDFVRVGEPLSPSNRQTILRHTTSDWYTYIHAGNEAPFLRSYRDALRFRVHPLDDVRRARVLSPRDPGRILERWGSFALGRIQRRRLLFHDPFAIFSLDWFTERLDCAVVVLVRHPLAVVSGLKRLGWDFDFRNLTRQPALLEDLLEPLREQIEQATASKSIVEQGSLLWRIVYSTVHERFASHPAVHVVRHEDLSLEPREGFRRLYEAVGGTYDEQARGTIDQHSSPDNPTELDRADPDARRLDSKANLANWRRRLSDDEIARILETAGPTAENFYPADDFQQILADGAARRA